MEEQEKLSETKFIAALTSDEESALASNTAEAQTKAAVAYNDMIEQPTVLSVFEDTARRARRGRLL